MQLLIHLFKQTGQNLRRTWGTQVMTLITVSLSVLIFAFFFLVYSNMLRAGERLGDDVRLIVYLQEEIPTAQRQPLEKKIREFGEVEKIVFVSRAEAFSRLTSQLGEDKDVLADLGPDFLPPSVEVYPRRTLKGLTQIAALSDQLLTVPGVSKVQYGREWLTRFGHFTSLLRLVVFLSGGLLIVSTTFIVSYTIRLTVLSRQNELEVLRLLGASSAYLRVPLLLEGLLQGIAGSGIGLIALYSLYLWITARFGGGGFLNLFDLTFFPAPVTAAILLGSVVLCSCGSLISIRRFMRI
ncbi:MAG: cell division protein FtsX [Thermodesulfobacteriota bacterium]